MIATIKNKISGSGLRRQKKREMMRHAQWTALDLFEARGFDAVTVEEVALAAGVSAPTLYRHFATKEGLVQWDEYDPMLLEELAERLRSSSPREAARDAVIRSLDRVYASDAMRILRRARLVNGHPELRAAVAPNLRAMQDDFARVFLRSGACRDAMEADVIASASVSALQVAIDHWVQLDGKKPLRDFMEQAFQHLVGLAGRNGRTAPAGRKR